jgi:hypothetical protein
MNTDDLTRIDCEEHELEAFVVAFVRRFHRLPSRSQVENARAKGDSHRSGD